MKDACPMFPRISILAIVSLSVLIFSQSSTIGADLAPVVSQDNNQLPDGWRFVGGRWSVKALARHAANRTATAAVVSKNHVAFPGICKTKKGTLLVVYREGFTHASGRSEDGRIMLVRSSDRGKTWASPELVHDDPAMDDRNAAVSCMNDGTICVIFDKYLNKNGSRSHHWAWMTTSADEGRTWSEPIKVSKTENVHTRSRALDLSNKSSGGKWLIPYSESSNSPMASSFFAIYNPNTHQFDEIAATPRGQRNLADETAVTKTADGQLVALIRSNDDPQLFQITSSDGGRTWSKPLESGIPSQFTPADLFTLDDGRLI
ncbi:MAG: sialidase family protein, partial [Planctomycetota bacterium]|nr:sialidase family protein [Planctomycetota bacterium]